MVKKIIDMAEADDHDLNVFLEMGLFCHYSEAHRDAVRKGIQVIKKERGINGTKEQENAS